MHTLNTSSAVIEELMGAGRWFRVIVRRVCQSTKSAECLNKYPEGERLHQP